MRPFVIGATPCAVYAMAGRLASGAHSVAHHGRIWHCSRRMQRGHAVSASVNVRRVAATTDRAWAAFVSARAASVFHSPPWARVLADTYGFAVEAAVLTDRHDAVAAGMPFCRISDPAGDRIVALPFCDHCDPLVDQPAQRRQLIDALAADAVPLTLVSLDATDADSLTVVKRAWWQGVALDGDTDALWARLAPSTRRAIRRAEREGVAVERVDGERFLREFSAMHVAVRKRKYRMLAQPATFFAAIRRHFDSVGGWLPLAAFHRGRCVAATIFLVWGDTLYYRFNASRPDALTLRPNDLLLWAGMRHASAAGLRHLDLGRSDLDQPGLIRFKRQFGAREREIRFLRRDPPGYTEAREQTWRGVMHSLTQLLTDPSVPDQITAAAGAALYRLFA